MDQRKLTTTASASMLFALIAGLAAGSGGVFPRFTQSQRKERKPFPTMVTASREEIAAWNDEVVEHKLLRDNPARLRREATFLPLATHRQQKRARMAPLRELRT